MLNIRDLEGWNVIRLAMLFACVAGCETHPGSADASRSLGELRRLTHTLDSIRESCGGYPAELIHLIGLTEASCDDKLSPELAGDIAKLRGEGFLFEDPGPVVIGKYSWSYTASQCGMSTVVGCRGYRVVVTPAVPENRWEFISEANGNIRARRTSLTLLERLLGVREEETIELKKF